MKVQNHSGQRTRLQPEEVSVAEAAQLLQVTERSILNFIRGHQIRATKVGKSWFLDKASVLAFQAERSTSHVGVSEKSVTVSENNVPVSETTSAVSEKLKGNRRPRLGLRGLNCYHLAVEIFTREAWGAVASDSFHLNSIPSKDIFVSRLLTLQLKILEALDAGYHTFGGTKTSHYSSARAAAGGLLALVSANKSLSGALENERELIEEKLLPALIALQRTAEKSRRT